MKKKLYKFCLTVLVFLISGMVFAQERIVDNAGLLSDTEKNELISLINAVSAAYNFDLVIVTENDIGIGYQNPGQYADFYFDNMGYGQDTGGDGCLFLFVYESGDYWFSTSGRGIGILNPSAFDKLESDTVRFLEKDDNAGAFRAFILDWKEFLVLDAKGRHYNAIQRWNIVIMVIVWLIALVIGLVVVNSWKQGMNTALPQTQAAAYVVSNSLVFKEKKDSFLYSNTSKTMRQSNVASSVAGTRLRSSGTRHGGGGGRIRR